MGLDFFNNLKEILEKNDTLSKIVDGVNEFIGELSEALQKEGSVNNDIVTQIANNNKLTTASENTIIQIRKDVLQEYANNTKDEGTLYFVFNKVNGEDKYRVWKYNGNNRTKTEIEGKDLPKDAQINSIMRVKNGELITDKEATQEILNEIKDRAKDVIERQEQQIEEYKKEGHTYLVTEDTNGRVFLWDSTEKPKKEIEDVYFPEELKDKAKEGSTFLYKNGNYIFLE